MPLTSRLLRPLRDRLRPSPPMTPPRLDDPVCVIGDLHGRRDLLEALLERVSTPGPRPRLVLVGDLIDRGPDSAGVLALVRGLVRSDPRVTCLMGNHERMMLDFLDDPAGAGPRWIAAGGGETLSSFGLSPWQTGDRPTGDARFADLAAGLREALPEGMEAWLRDLPLSWRDGDLAVTHAGADPDRPLEEQDPGVLLWGGAVTARRPRRDGLWLAHGHVVVPRAGATAGRIAVDTGAWRSGRLSAALIGPEGLSFLEITLPAGQGDGGEAP